MENLQGIIHMSADKSFVFQYSDVSQQSNLPPVFKISAGGNITVASNLVFDSNAAISVSLDSNTYGMLRVFDPNDPTQLRAIQSGAIAITSESQHPVQFVPSQGSNNNSNITAGSIESMITTVHDSVWSFESQTVPNIHYQYGNVGIGTDVVPHHLSVFNLAGSELFSAASNAVRMGRDTIPITTESYNLGSNVFRFNNLYLSGYVNRDEVITTPTAVLRPYAKSIITSPMPNEYVLPPATVPFETKTVLFEGSSASAGLPCTLWAASAIGASNPLPLTQISTDFLWLNDYWIESAKIRTYYDSNGHVHIGDSRANSHALFTVNQNGGATDMMALKLNDSNVAVVSSVGTLILGSNVAVPVDASAYAPYKLYTDGSIYANTYCNLLLDSFMDTSLTKTTTASNTHVLYLYAISNSNVAYSASNRAYSSLLLTGGVISGDLTVQGNMVVTGSNTIVHTTNMSIFDQIIELNRGGSDVAPLPNMQSGFEIQRGITQSNYLILYDESTQQLRIGFSNSPLGLQTVATRETNVPEGSIAFWNASKDLYTFNSNVIIDASEAYVGIGTTASDKPLTIYDKTSFVMSTESNQVVFQANLMPSHSNIVDIGAADKRFRTVYVSNLDSIEVITDTVTTDTLYASSIQPNNNSTDLGSEQNPFRDIYLSREVVDYRIVTEPYAELHTSGTSILAAPLWNLVVASKAVGSGPGTGNPIQLRTVLPEDADGSQSVYASGKFSWSSLSSNVIYEANGAQTDAMLGSNANFQHGTHIVRMNKYGYVDWVCKLGSASSNVIVNDLASTNNHVYAVGSWGTTASATLMSLSNNTGALTGGSGKDGFIIRIDKDTGLILQQARVTNAFLSDQTVDAIATNGTNVFVMTKSYAPAPTYVDTNNNSVIDSSITSSAPQFSLMKYTTGLANDVAGTNIQTFYWTSAQGNGNILPSLECHNNDTLYIPFERNSNIMYLFEGSTTLPLKTSSCFTLINTNVSTVPISRRWHIDIQGLYQGSGSIGVNNSYVYIGVTLDSTTNSCDLYIGAAAPILTSIESGSHILRYSHSGLAPRISKITDASYTNVRIAKLQATNAFLYVTGHNATSNPETLRNINATNTVNTYWSIPAGPCTFTVKYDLSTEQILWVTAVDGSSSSNNLVDVTASTTSGELFVGVTACNAATTPTRFYDRFGGHQLTVQPSSVDSFAAVVRYDSLGQLIVPYTLPIVTDATKERQKCIINAKPYPYNLTVVNSSMATSNVHEYGPKEQHYLWVNDAEWIRTTDPAWYFNGADEVHTHRMVAIGHSDPHYNLDVRGSIYAEGYCNLLSSSWTDLSLERASTISNVVYLYTEFNAYRSNTEPYLTWELARSDFGTLFYNKGPVAIGSSTAYDVGETFVHQLYVNGAFYAQSYCNLFDASLTSKNNIKAPTASNLGTIYSQLSTLSNVLTSVNTTLNTHPIWEYTSLPANTSPIYYINEVRVGSNVQSSESEARKLTVSGSIWANRYENILDDNLYSVKTKQAPTASNLNVLRNRIETLSNNIVTFSNSMYTDFATRSFVEGLSNDVTEDIGYIMNVIDTLQAASGNIWVNAGGEKYVVNPIFRLGLGTNPFGISDQAYYAFIVNGGIYAKRFNLIVDNYSTDVLTPSLSNTAPSQRALNEVYTYTSNNFQNYATQQNFNTLSNNVLNLSTTVSSISSTLSSTTNTWNNVNASTYASSNKIMIANDQSEYTDMIAFDVNKDFALRVKGTLYADTYSNVAIDSYLGTDTNKPPSQRALNQVYLMQADTSNFARTNVPSLQNSINILNAQVSGLQSFSDEVIFSATPNGDWTTFDSSQINIDTELLTSGYAWSNQTANTEYNIMTPTYGTVIGDTLDFSLSNYILSFSNTSSRIFMKTNVYVDSVNPLYVAFSGDSNGTPEVNRTWNVVAMQGMTSNVTRSLVADLTPYLTPNSTGSRLKFYQTGVGQYGVGTVSVYETTDVPNNLGGMWMASNYLNFTRTKVGIMMSNHEVPTVELEVRGTILATVDVQTTSDVRTKTHLSNIDDALGKVCALQGYTFNRTIENYADRRYMGLLAQDVLSVAPEAVSSNDEGILNVSYGNLMGIVVEAIKELKTSVDSLHKRIDALMG